MKRLLFSQQVHENSVFARFCEFVGIKICFSFPIPAAFHFPGTLLYRRIDHIISKNFFLAIQYSINPFPTIFYIKKLLPDFFLFFTWSGNPCLMPF